MNIMMGVLKAVSALAVLGIVITIFRALLALTGQLRPHWRPRTHKGIAIGVIILLIGCSYVLLKGKFCATKPDYLSLREVAINAYHRKDYNSVVGITSWVLQFQRDDDSFYRLRALAYKRLGDYRSEIKDRTAAFELNPGRARNILPIIEDYILLREYDNAEAWIQRYTPSVSDSDVRTMFEFLNLVCEVLKGNEHASRVAHLKTTITSRPLSKEFVQRYWEWGPLSNFINASQVSSADRALLQSLAGEMQRTAR